MRYLKKAYRKYNLSQQVWHVNQHDYQTGCLEKILHPFIQNKHSGDDLELWPDKGSFHYAKKTLEYL